MRQFWLFVIAMIAVWPVAWTLTSIGDKPIDMIASDLLLILMPVIYFLARTKPTKAQLESVTGKARSFLLPPALAAVVVIYCMSLAGIGVGMSGENVRLFSAFKLAKPFGFLIVGYLLGSWVDPYQFIDRISRAAGFMIGATLFCTITEPNFPFGEWGRFVFGSELSGYPNSPMTFFGCLVPLLLAWADYSRDVINKGFAWGLAGCTALIILGSMSRSSTIVMVIATSIYLVSTGRVAVLSLSFLFVLVLSVIGFGLFTALRDTEVVTVLMDRVQARTQRTVASDDPSSGRFEIWESAVELCSESPIFGYLFEPFSHYSVFDTPHQQYLEVLYKCGSLGLLFYLGTIACSFRASKRLLRMTPRGSTHYYQLHALRATLLSLMMGNFTQPNLTYSVTGNFLFLVYGCLCSSRAVIAISKPIKPAQPKPSKTLAAPRLRIAG